MEFTKNNEFEGTLDGVISSVYDWWSGEVITEPALKSMKEFLDASAGKAVKINISSMGGEIDSALVLADAIKTHGRVTMRARGLVASSGTILLCAANKVEVDEYSQIMIHQAKGGNFGTAQEVRDTADMIERYTDTIIQMYVDAISRNGKLVDGDIEKTRKKMKDMVYSKDYYLSAKDAVDLGLANKVTGMGQIAKEAKNPMQASAQKAAWINQVAALSQRGIPVAVLNSAGASLGIETEESRGIYQKLKAAFNAVLASILPVTSEVSENETQQPQAEQIQAVAQANAPETNNLSTNQSETEMGLKPEEIEALVKQSVEAALASAQQKATAQAEADELAKMKAELETAKAQNEALKAKLAVNDAPNPLDLANQNAAKPAQQNQQPQRPLSAKEQAAAILMEKFPTQAAEFAKVANSLG